MSSLRDAVKQLGGISRRGKTVIGNAGYDNPRENIDPHIRTQAIDTKELKVHGLTAGSVLFSDGSNITEDNSNLFWDDTNNRLGIGTATPANDLDVVAAGSATVVGRITNAGRGVTLTATNADVNISSIGVSQDLTFKAGNTNNADYLFTSTGNSGIGTTTPSSRLEVVGEITQLSNLGSVQGDVTGTIHFPRTAGDEDRVRLSTVWEGADRDQQGLAIYTNSSATSSVAPTEKVRITNDGNVGIGVTDPDEKLEVVDGNIKIDSATAANLILDKGAANRGGDILFRTAGSERWTVGCADSDIIGDGTDFRIGRTSSDPDIFIDRTNGDVGIGTSSPEHQLHILDTDANARVLIESDAVNGAAVIEFRNDLIEWSMGVSGGLSDDFYLQDVTNNTFPLRVQHGAPTASLNIISSGNVGIGTASAGAKLHVDDTGTDLLKLKRTTETDNTSCRLEFGCDTTYYKAGIYFLRESGVTNGRGSLNFAVDPNDDAADADTGHTVLTMESAGGYLHGAGTTGFPYGEIYVEGNSTADTVATATSTQITRFDVNGASLNTTPDHTNDHITITKAGHYMVNVSLAFSGDASVDWKFTLCKNNGAANFLNVHTNRKLGSGGDIGSASMSGIVDLAVNDTVEIWMIHGAGVNKDITVQDCTLSIVAVGGT